MAVGRPKWPGGATVRGGQGGESGRGGSRREMSRGGGRGGQPSRHQRQRRNAPALEALNRFKNRRRQRPSAKANAMVMNNKNHQSSITLTRPDNAHMAMDGDHSFSKADDASYHASAPTRCLQRYTLYDSDHNPFQIGPDAMVSPRADAWFFLFISSCTSASALSASLHPEAWRTATERMALAVVGISTVVSATTGIAFRYGPSRSFLTRGITNRAGRLLHSNLTAELILVILGLFLNLVFAALVFQPSNYMAVSESEIWNTNLFFATWLSLSLSSYLIADLLTVHDASGVLPKEYSLVMGNAISRGWTLLFLSAIALLAFSISFRSGVTCSGVYMRTTSVCQTTTLMGILFGILGMLMVGTYLMISLFEMRSTSNHETGNTPDANHSKSKRNIASSVLGAVLLICYCINAAFVTNPAMYRDMGEPSMNTPPNLYFTSWICFALSFYLCLRNVEVFLVPGSLKTVSPLVIMSAGEQKTKRRVMRRGSSRESASTMPESQYSDNEGTNYDDLDMEEQSYAGAESHVFDADEVLTGMVDSQSEDGPMLFLPTGGGVGADAPSDLEDDLSYPSMTHKALPQLRNSPKQFGQQQRQQLQPPPQRGLRSFKSIPNLGREPHKPRSVNPSGIRASMVASSAAPQHNTSNTTKTVRNNASRPQAADPSDSSGDERRKQDPRSSSESFLVNGNNTKQPMDPHESSDEFHVEDIDTKLQAKISSSSGSEEVINMARSKRRQNPINKKTNNNIMQPRTRATNQMTDYGVSQSTGLRSSETQSYVHNTGIRSSDNRSFNVDSETSSHHTPDNRESSFFVETVHSESLSGMSLGNDNPLDRPKRPAFSTQPSIGMKPLPQQSPLQPPPFQRAPRRETLMSAMMEQNIPSDSVNSDITSVAKTGSGSNLDESAAGGKSRSTRSSSKSKKSRSSSRKKRRSKSGDRSKKSKSSNTTSKSPSRSRSNNSKSRKRQSMKSSTGSGTESGSYYGPPTVSQDSNGPGGPPTMSASGDSIPRTNDGEEEPVVHRMGHVGPRGEVPAYGLSPDTEDGDDTRPVRRIHGSPDNMSMVSEPTMDGFEDPDQRRKGGEFREGGTMRYSNTDGLNLGSETSSQTNENRVLRQGAVDKMVMEALRQAQEARQTSHHTDMGPPRRAPSHVSNPQGHSMSDPNKMGEALPHNTIESHQHRSLYSQGGSRESRSRSSKSTKSKSKSPHGSNQKKKELSFRIDDKNQKHRAAIGSGSAGRSGQRSMHSFYSQSMDGTNTTPSMDGGDAFAC